MTSPAPWLAGTRAPPAAPPPHWPGRRSALAAASVHAALSQTGPF